MVDYNYNLETWNQNIFMLCFLGREEVLLVTITLDRKLKGCCRFCLKMNQKVSPKLGLHFVIKTCCQVVQ